MPLDDRAIRLLDFERQWWTYAGDKPAAIRAEFGIDPADYQAELDRIIFTDDALAHDRMLVKRLRRLTAQRRRQGRTAPRPAAAPPKPAGGSACKSCGTSWPADQLNLRGNCPNCLWGAA